MTKIEKKEEFLLINLLMNYNSRLDPNIRELGSQLTNRLHLHKVSYNFLTTCIKHVQVTCSHLATVLTTNYNWLWEMLNMKVTNSLES